MSSHLPARPPTPAEELARIRTHIVHNADGLVVVDKPPGLVSAGPPHHIHGEPAARQSVESLLVALLARPVWTVHQLDRMTSGLNCFVLKASLVAPWAERLKVPGTKRYLAIVHGHLAPGRHTISLPLGLALDPQTGKTQPAVVAPAAPSARPALTHATALTHNPTTPDLPPVSLVEVELETGRQHQVRLHLAALGHPLVGEPLHVRPPCTLHPRHALHAARLDFAPTPRAPALHLQAPLPDDLRDLARRLALPLP